MHIKKHKEKVNTTQPLVVAISSGFHLCSEGREAVTDYEAGQEAGPPDA